MEIQKSQWGDLSRVWAVTENGQTIVIQGVVKPEKMVVLRNDRPVDEVPDLTALAALVDEFNRLVQGCVTSYRDA